MEVDYVLDQNGAPALVLAGATIIVPTTRSGNPGHEAGTGRFGTGSGKAKPGAKRAAKKPAATDDSQTRRRDAVVDAARTLPDLTAEGVREFVRQRWRGTRALTEEDVAQFSLDAQAQRMNDVVDALDARLRGSVFGKGRQNVVGVNFPRGLVRNTLRSFDDNQVNEVVQRLRVRGWSVSEIKRNVLSSYQLKDRVNLADEEVEDGFGPLE